MGPGGGLSVHAVLVCLGIALDLGSQPVGRYSLRVTYWISCLSDIYSTVHKSSKITIRN